MRSNRFRRMQFIKIAEVLPASLSTCSRPHAGARCSDSGDHTLIERGRLEVRLHGQVLSLRRRAQLLWIREAILDRQAGDQARIDLADELDVRGTRLRLHLFLDGLLLLPM